MCKPVPPQWRQILAEVFVEAESKCLGEMTVESHDPGLNDQAAEFIPRCDFLADKRRDGAG